MIFAASPTPDMLDSPSPGVARSTHVPPAIVLIPQAEFVACIDSCVQALATDPSGAIEPAATQLRTWLDGNTQILETGALIDLEQFDSTILSAEERAPKTGPKAQAGLLRACRALAEAVYAKR